MRHLTRPLRRNLLIGFTFVPVRNHWETCGHGFEWVGDRLKIEYG